MPPPHLMGQYLFLPTTVSLSLFASYSHHRCNPTMDLTHLLEHSFSHPVSECTCAYEIVHATFVVALSQLYCTGWAAMSPKVTTSTQPPTQNSHFFVSFDKHSWSFVNEEREATMTKNLPKGILVLNKDMRSLLGSWHVFAYVFARRVCHTNQTLSHPRICLRCKKPPINERDR